MNNKEKKKELCSKINEVIGSYFLEVMPSDLSIENKGKETFVRLKLDHLEMLLYAHGNYRGFYKTIQGLAVELLSEELADVYIDALRSRQEGIN